MSSKKGKEYVCNICNHTEFVQDRRKGFTGELINDIEGGWIAGVWAAQEHAGITLEEITICSKCIEKINIKV